jgi:peptidoglycan/LPS O-acetylase OafA/YrhL
MGDFLAKERLVELDAIRGIAAMMVVGYHFTTRYQEVVGHSAPVVGLPWGEYGVPLFFGLSGFVISMTLERTRTAMDFAVSRFSRLYPAYFVAILITSIVVFTGGVPEFQSSPTTVALNFTMLQGFLRVPHVDGSYWTLEVELVFYGVMFALLLMRKLSWMTAVIIGWIAFKWIWWLHPLSYTLTEMVVEYIPYFAIGVACYRLWAKQEAPAAWLTILFAVVTLWVIDGATRGVVGVLVALVFALFAYGKLNFLRWPPLVWLGGVSYTLYLLHANIGWTLIHRLEGAGTAPYLAIAVALTVSVILAYGVTQLVERPALRIIRRAWDGLRKAARPPSELHDGAQA